LRSVADLIHLNGTIDVVCEDEACPKTNGSSEDKEAEGKNPHVSKVQQGANELRNLEFGVEIENGVGKHVYCRRTSCKEGAPPPVVILRTKLEVAHHNANFGACHTQNQEHEQQKPEYVVVVVQPNRGQNEEELNEHCTKRQQPTHKN